MTAGELENDAELFLTYGRVDWYVTKSWKRLHYCDLTLTGDLRLAIEMDWAVLEPVTLACGRAAAGLWIPGIFSRTGLPRCPECCKATGMPPGRGSPKNDKRCRRVLGLPQKEQLPAEWPG